MGPLKSRPVAECAASAERTGAGLRLRRSGGGDVGECDCYCHVEGGDCRASGASQASGADEMTEGACVHGGNSCQVERGQRRQKDDDAGLISIHGHSVRWRCGEDLSSQP